MRGKGRAARGEQHLPERVYDLARGTEGLSLVLLDAVFVLGAWTVSATVALSALDRTLGILPFLGFVALATAAKWA